MDVLGIEPKIWFPVVTLIVGGVLKGAGDLVTHRRTTDREREARQEQRRDTARIRRIDFQRTTLLELQEVSQGLVRSTVTLHLEDTEGFRKTGDWGKTPTSEVANEGARAGHAGLSKLQSRVRNEAVRRLAQELSSACTSVTTARSEEHANNAFRQMADAPIELNEQIGIVLRTLEDEEDGVLESPLA